VRKNTWQRITLTVNEIDRVLVVGYGSIGKRHSRILQQNFPEVEIALLRNKKPWGIVSSEDHGLRQFYEFDEALLYQPKAVLIANPAPLHIETAERFINAGIHVLVEKPLSHSLEGLDEFIVSIEQSKLILMTGYNLRFLPSLIAFRELLKEKKCGQIYSVRAEVGQYLPAWRPDIDYRQSVSAQSDTGGGVLLELSHELDYLQWLFGKISWISAVIAKTSKLDIDVEDTAHLLLGHETPGDKQLLITKLDMDFIRHDFTRTCTAIGENGTLQWNGVLGTVSFYSPDTDSWVVLHETPDERDLSFINEWSHFFDCIRETKQPMITAKDGQNVLHAIEAARESSVSGKKVVVNY
jgi:predicted dehydrogenase